MKILIGAYACEPHRGSEPGVGWNWSVQAAKHGHEVDVITSLWNRQVIEEELQRRPVRGLRFHYLDLPQPLARQRERFSTYSELLYYYAWQVALARKARKLHRDTGFDLAHHVTFAIDWMPSGLCVLEIPFVWGPIGGSTHEIPKNIRLDLPRYASKFESRRRLMQQSFLKYDPFVRRTRRRAARIMTYTEEALAAIPDCYRDKTQPITHIGVSKSDLPTRCTASRTPMLDRTFTVFTGGRLVHWKGFDLLLEGMAHHVRETDSPSRLLVTGEGAYAAILKGLTGKLGIGDHVEFLGRLPSRDDVFHQMQDSHLYALPTLRDGPPVAILEAMFAGMPILCLDHGATKELVPNNAGLKIPMHHRDQIARDIGDALTWSKEHRAELCEMGARGRQHTLHAHDWNRIGDEIQQVYESVASNGQA